VALIAKAAGKDIELEFDTTRPEGRFVKSADMSLFRSLAPDFVNEVELADGLRRMLEWYGATFRS